MTIERESSQKFPDNLKRFLGFNRQELSKHRKRIVGNLSRGKLPELSMCLREAVQVMLFAKSDEWCSLKIECLKVAHVMDDYARYLLQTKQKMLKLHATPQSSIEKNANVKVLPVSATPHYKLTLLDEKVKDTEPFVPVCVLEYLNGSQNRKQVYDVIHSHLHLGGYQSNAFIMYVP